MISNSTSSNSSFCPHPPFVSPSLLFHITCISTSSQRFIFIAFYVAYILLTLPLYIFILYSCLKRYWRSRATCSVAVTSHPECLTCHVSVMELIGISGYAFSICGIIWSNPVLMLAGLLLAKFTWYGETLCLVLTCAELYLAVVHPITYRKLKTKRGIRIRNVTITCVWMFCFIMVGLAMLDFVTFMDLCLLIISLLGISFFILSILWALIRPPLRDQSGDRDRVDKSKLKAFYTIVLILGVLVLRFAWGLLWTVQDTLGGGGLCLTITWASLFNTPSTLVLPLLFLQKSGNFMCCRKTIQ